MRYSSLLLALLVSACSSVPQVILPPEHLLRDCSIPSSIPRTNGELAQLALDRKLALIECNIDKAALREFFSR